MRERFEELGNALFAGLPEWAKGLTDKEVRQRRKLIVESLQSMKKFTQEASGEGYNCADNHVSSGAEVFDDGIYGRGTIVGDLLRSALNPSGAIISHVTPYTYEAERFAGERSLLPMAIATELGQAWGITPLALRTRYPFLFEPVVISFRPGIKIDTHHAVDGMESDNVTRATVTVHDINPEDLAKFKAWCGVDLQAINMQSRALSEHKI